MPVKTPTFQDYLRRRHAALGDGNSEPVSNQIDLYNDKTFYKSFIKDILEAKEEVIIYSPFVSKFRTDFMKPIIEKARNRNIEVFVFTRPVEDYEPIFQDQIRVALERYEELGVNVYYRNLIHEKVSVIDRTILWEGSLNILSQRASREMMRRTVDEGTATQIVSYLNLGRQLAEGYKQRYEKLCRNLMADTKRNMRLKFRIFFWGFSVAALGWIILISFWAAASPENLRLLSSILRLIFS